MTVWSVFRLACFGLENALMTVTEKRNFICYPGMCSTFAYQVSRYFPDEETLNEGWKSLILDGLWKPL